MSTPIYTPTYFKEVREQRITCVACELGAPTSTRVEIPIRLADGRRAIWLVSPGIAAELRAACAAAAIPSGLPAEIEIQVSSQNGKYSYTATPPTK